MARKPSGRQFVHHKATTVELSDGWNLVTSSKVRTTETAKSKSSPSSSLACNEENVSALCSEVDSCLKLWNLSQSCSKLTIILERAEFCGKQPDLAICLGLGCISRTDSYDLKKSSLWQLAVFLSMSKLLSSSKENTAESSPVLYAQEPRFEALDVTVLKSYSVDVLHKLDAKDLITPKTFLFAPFLPWPVLLQDLLLDEDPAICVALNIRGCLEQVEIMIKNGKEEVFEGESLSVEQMKTCLKVGEKFLEGRSDIEFPDFELHSSALRGLRIYTKTEKQGSVED
jgi:hypothetical protein